MGDYMSLPSWRRAVSFAHAACAVAEGIRAPDPEVRSRFRKAAVSVPSLLAEAFLDPEARESGEVLLLLGCRLDEVKRLLSDGPVSSSLSEEDRAALLEDLGTLREEIRALSWAAGRSAREPG